MAKFAVVVAVSLLTLMGCSSASSVESPKPASPRPPATIDRRAMGLTEAMNTCNAWASTSADAPAAALLSAAKADAYDARWSRLSESIYGLSQLPRNSDSWFNAASQKDHLRYLQLNSRVKFECSKTTVP